MEGHPDDRHPAGYVSDAQSGFHRAGHDDGSPHQQGIRLRGGLSLPIKTHAFRAGRRTGSGLRHPDQPGLRRRKFHTGEEACQQSVCHRAGGRAHHARGHSSLHRSVSPFSRHTGNPDRGRSPVFHCPADHTGSYIPEQRIYRGRTGTRKRRPDLPAEPAGHHHQTFPHCRFCLHSQLRPCHDRGRFADLAAYPVHLRGQKQSHRRQRFQLFGKGCHPGQRGDRTDDQPLPAGHR